MHRLWLANRRKIVMNFNFNPSAFLDSLPYMGKGMLGIFIVIGIIIGVTTLLNAVTSKKDKKQ